MQEVVCFFCFCSRWRRLGKDLLDSVFANIPRPLKKTFMCVSRRARDIVLTTSPTVRLFVRVDNAEVASKRAARALPLMRMRMRTQQTHLTLDQMETMPFDEGATRGLIHFMLMAVQHLCPAISHLHIRAFDFSTLETIRLPNVRTLTVFVPRGVSLKHVLGSLPGLQELALDLPVDTDQWLQPALFQGAEAMPQVRVLSLTGRIVKFYIGHIDMPLPAADLHTLFPELQCLTALWRMEWLLVAGFSKLRELTVYALQAPMGTAVLLPSLEHLHVTELCLYTAARLSQRTTIHLGPLQHPLLRPDLPEFMDAPDPYPPVVTLRLADESFKPLVLPYLRERGHLIVGLDSPDITVWLDIPAALLLDVLDAVGHVLRGVVAVSPPASNSAVLYNSAVRQRTPHAKDVVVSWGIGALYAASGTP
jgi:hypothetical protein